MEWISSWIQGIIIAVIIGTIIEMLLPEGNCKKYIKVVIGVYVLFSIISPVITKITGNDFRVSNIFDLDKYIEISSQNNTKQIEVNQENQIKELYSSNLKTDIKQKIEQKGYEVSNITVGTDEEYALKSISVQIYKKESEENIENNNTNKIEIVDKVEIKIGNNESNDISNEEIKQELINISSKEIQNLKQYLADEYNLEENKININ